MDRDIREQDNILRQLEIHTAALDTSNDAVYLHDDTLRFVYVNVTACRSLGYSREELLTMGPSDIDPDVTPERARALMNEMVSFGGLPKFETRHRAKDGRIYPVEISGSLFSHEGRAFGLSVVRDITEHKRLEDALRFVAQRGWQDDGKSFFDALARYLGQTLGVDYAMVAKLGETPGSAETVALYARGTLVQNMRYELANAPCEHVMGRDYCCYPSGVRQSFPKNRLLDDMGVDSYAGIPLWDSFGQPLGLIAVLDGKPLRNEVWVARLLQVMAPRAAAELERASSDARLRASERDFRSLAESSPDCIIRYDRAGRILYLNSQLVRELGIAAATDVIGRPTHEIWPDERFAEVERTVARAMETATDVTLETEVPSPGGEPQFSQLRIVPERDDAGEVIGAIAFGRDITELKRYQQTLSAREREFRSLAENAPDMIARYDLQGRLLYVNPRLADALGVAACDAVGKMPRELLPSWDMAPISTVIATGEPLEIEFSAPDSRAAVHQFQVRFVAERGPQGDIVGVLAIGRDISKSKRAERDLLILSSAINNASDGILLVNDQLRFAYVNDRACRSLGYSRDELMKMGPTDVGIPREVVERTYGELAVDGPHPGRLETRHRAADGRVFPIEVSASVVEHENGKMALVVARDITERKQAEAEHQAHVRFLESLNRIDRAIQSANDLDTMMSDVLDTVLAIFDCDRAYLLFPCDPLAAGWQVPMERTRPEYPGAHALGKEFPMDNEVATNMRVLLDSDGPAQFGPGGAHAVPTDISTRFGFKCVMSMVVYPRVDKPWVFGIHQCSHVRVWSAEEETLFHEIGRRLTDGITSLLAHRRVQESEAHLRTLVQTIPDLVWLKDPNGVFLHCNSRFERLFGGTIKEIVGKTDYDFVERDLADFFRENDRKALLAGKSSINEEWLTFAADGYRGLFETVRTPLRDETGKLIGVLSIARDITERNRMEHALRRREEEFRSLAEHLPDIVMRYDLECRSVYVNPAYLREVEIPVEEALNVAPDARYWRSTNVSLDEYKALLKQVMATGTPVELMLDWTRGSDSVAAHYSMEMVAERDADGCIIGALCIGRNVIKLMESERRLEESRRQLRDLAARREDAREEERRHIARELHDELGQQLSALRFNLALLAYEFGEAQPQVREAVDKLLSLVGKTIRTTREVSSALRPAVLDMGVVPALEWLVSEYAMHGGVSFELQGKLGNVDMNDTCTLVVFRVVQESLTNAVRHSGADRIKVVFGRDADAYVVEVRDNGVGFDPEGPRDRRSVGLLGIRERALAVGGELLVSSSPGWGTVLRVRIPAGENRKEKS